MTTRLKTVHFAFPALTGAITDNTLTSFTQITVYLPEAAGAVTFRRVIVMCSVMATEAGSGNITTRQIQARLGAVGYTSHTNSNTHTGSGEDIFDFIAVDMTAHFAANWSGTSMTMDAQCLFDSTMTTPGFINACATVEITYEYDDTQATQIKTVFLPLNAPVGALATSKPGSPTATIPNLSTELPEASKVFRASYVVMQGNSASGATDATIAAQLDSTSQLTTGLFEAGLASDYWYRFVWDVSGVLNTGASMGYYIWASIAKFNHMQAYLVVTYEFDASSSNDMYVSVMLPMELGNGVMGGTTSSDYTRGSRQLRIAEPGSITTKAVAFFPHWEQQAAIAGLNFRVGTGSFVTYTDTAAIVCGSNGAMVRNDGAFSLARGNNTLTFDAYRTDATDLGWNTSGFWIVNYTASKPAGGYGAANHTVMWNLGPVFDGAAATDRVIAATAPVIPETVYMLTAIGTRSTWISNSTGIPAGIVIDVERLAGEGGVAWESAYTGVSDTDPETGARWAYSQIRDEFLRWPGDLGADRMDVETARRWRILLGRANAATCAGFFYLDLLVTYHTITFTISGTVSGSGGGTVTLNLCRADTGEKVLTTSRSGDGAYSFTWYDDVTPMYVEAYEDTDHAGRSANGQAA